MAKFCTYGHLACQQLRLYLTLPRAKTKGCHLWLSKPYLVLLQQMRLLRKTTKSVTNKDLENILVFLQDRQFLYFLACCSGLSDVETSCCGFFMPAHPHLPRDVCSLVLACAAKLSGELMEDLGPGSKFHFLWDININISIFPLLVGYQI